jgi:hypothetical protein
MKDLRLRGGLIFVLAVGFPACSDDMMSMDNELADLARHHSEFEVDTTAHHADVLGAADLAYVRGSEAAFGRGASAHLDAMEHRMRDMEDMCSMAGHSFESGPMRDTMARVRSRLQQHHERMAASMDTAVLATEEGAFRDSMVPMMAEMRQHQDDARRSAPRYSCRMHGHQPPR